MRSAYALIPRLRKPSIDPGDKVEIEIFMTGYGPVKQNKLFISYSSPKLIDVENPGVLEYCISTAKDTRTGKIISPVSGKKYLKSHLCDPVGLIVVLTEGYFLDIPKQSPPSNAIPMIMPEHTWDGMPPLLLALNTSKKTPPGDYDIYLVLTYSARKQILTDQKKVTVHVKSAVERHWKKATILAIAITAFSILLAIANYAHVL